MSLIALAAVTWQLLGLVGIAAAGPEGNALAVGWARADLTPDRPVALAGQMRTRISKAVRDPVTCTALAIESRRGGTCIDQAVMVSCDLVAIGPRLDAAVAAWHERIVAACPGLDPDKIVLNATHTHAGPLLGDDDVEPPPGAMACEDYLAFAAERIAGAIVEAWNARAPGRFGWALAHVAVAHNRRVVSFDPATGLPAAGRTTMYGRTDAADFDSLEGPTDTGMPVLGFWDANGGLTGLVANLSCPAQETAHIGEISADFWHETRAGLAADLGSGVFVLPQCGAAGASTSELLWRRAAEEEMRRRRGLSGREEIARRIVAGVRDVLDTARREAVADPVVRHVMKTVRLPQRLVTAAERDRALADAAAAPPDRPAKAAWHRLTASRFERQQAALAAGRTPTLPVRVHAVRIGDVAIVTNPFELFEEYGVRIQARSPAVLTCVVQLASGGPAGTYLPTARAVEGGGYSAVVESNLVGPDGGRILVDESVAMLRELWSDEAAR